MSTNIEQDVPAHDEPVKIEPSIEEKETKLASVQPEVDPTQSSEIKEEKPEIKCFQCSTCILNEKYEYFGKSPPWVKDYKLEEESYVIEDPFLPPKRGEFLVLGAHCVKCNKAVCKDSNCSFYFGGTFCIKCAKESRADFPKPVQDKLNRIVVPS